MLLPMIGTTEAMFGDACVTSIQAMKREAAEREEQRLQRWEALGRM